MNPRVHRGCGGGVKYAGPAPADGRPQFRCSKCGDTWTSGLTGGRWAALVPAQAPPLRAFHHYFPADGKSFSEDFDPATLRTGCGVPAQRGHVMPELNHVTCEACLRAYRERL